MASLRQFLNSFRRRPKAARDGPSPQDLLNGYRTTALLHIAAKLKIADRLANGPQSSQQLAQPLKAHAPSLHRVLRGLVAMGFCQETPEGHFQLTPLGEKFRSDTGRPEYNLAILNGGEYVQAWSHLLDSTLTGKTAFDFAFGESPWEHRQKNPELNDCFNTWLEDGAATTGRAINEAYDFSACQLLADIGGNEGALLATILQARPTLRGILMDQPHVISAAQRRLETAGVQGRCEIAGGNFMVSVPAGADVYILKSILHDWEDDTCRIILKNCHQAMKPGQPLLVIERIMPDRVEAGSGTIMSDLHMLAVTGGQERTVEQYRALGSAAGFSLRTTVPLKTGHWLLELVKS